MNPNSFDQSPDQPRKKGFGCLLKTLIGIVVLVTAIIGGSWLLIMHSPLPLRLVTNLIEEGGADSKLKITGVSGSLASGLGFKKIEWIDGEITDLRFRYSGIMNLIRRKELIIYEMHVGSATIDTTFFSETSEEPKSTEEPSPESESTDDDPSEIEPTGTPSTKGTSSEPLLRLVRIDRVSLNRINIKNATTGNNISIPEIEWTGFKYEDGAPLEMGDLKADSDHLVIKTTAPTASGYQKRVEITLLPKLHTTILKPIHINALVGEQKDKAIFEIKAFDETLTLSSSPDGSQRILAAGTNLADFIDAPLPNNLQLEAEIDEPTLSVGGGSFLLGIKTFEIQATTATETDKKPEGIVFLALHRGDDIEIRYEIPVTESKDEEQSFTPLLTSTPTMTPENLMAHIFHDREFSALPAQDREKLHKQMTWFSFAE